MEPSPLTAAASGGGALKQLGHTFISGFSSRSTVTTSK